jgi:hypothetical protein
VVVGRRGKGEQEGEKKREGRGREEKEIITRCRGRKVK